MMTSRSSQPTYLLFRRKFIGSCQSLIFCPSIFIEEYLYITTGEHVQNFSYVTGSPNFSTVLLLLCSNIFLATASYKYLKATSWQLTSTMHSSLLFNFLCLHVFTVNQRIFFLLPIGNFKGNENSSGMFYLTAKISSVNCYVFKEISRWYEVILLVFWLSVKPGSSSLKSTVMVRKGTRVVT